MSIKYYRNDREIAIVVVPLAPNKKCVRWCMSPIFQCFPGCLYAFYSCEWEEHFGPVKHNPEFVKHKRIKKGTSVNCRDMPLEMCQCLLDADKLFCPTCKQKVEV